MVVVVVCVCVCVCVCVYSSEYVWAWGGVNWHAHPRQTMFGRMPPSPEVMRRDRTPNRRDEAMVQSTNALTWLVSSKMVCMGGGRWCQAERCAWVGGVGVNMVLVEVNVDAE